MNNKLYYVGITILIILGLLWFNRGYDIVNYPSGNRGIVAFGDSLVYGTGSSKGKNFVDIISDKLNLQIVNEGVPGNTTSDGLDRVESVAQTKPKVVILLLGGNDALRRIPKATTFENLETIIRTFQKQGSIVVLLGVRGGLLGDSYKGDFADLAKETGSAYVPDVLDGVFGRPSLMYDSIHPNDRGYALIADKVAPVLQSVLR